MRAVFIGTVEVSWHSLQALIELCSVVGIYTMPKEKSEDISAYADLNDLGEKHGIPVYQVTEINTDQVVRQIREMNPDIIVCIGWPRLVKEPILSLPPKGCVGMHSSLLPKYRGGAPVNWGIIEGQKSWGISLMYLGAGADNGDIIAQTRFRIGVNETCGDTYNKISEATVRILQTFIPLIANGTAPRIAQDESQATLYKQRKPEDGQLDWNKSARQLHDWIRALTHPYPGAFTYLMNQRKCYIWKARVEDENVIAAKAGVVVDILPFRGLLVQCGTGQLLIERIQLEEELEISTGVWAAHMKDEFPRFFVSE